MDSSCDTCLWVGKQSEVVLKDGVPVCPACSGEQIDYHDSSDNSDAIKIHVTIRAKDLPGGESLWAFRLGPKTAEVANIPFFTSKLCIGDIVSFRDKGCLLEFGRVLKRKSRCFQVRYRDGAFPDLANRLRTLGMRVEGAFPGFASVAFPAKWSESKLNKSMNLVNDLLVEF